MAPKDIHMKDQDDDQLNHLQTPPTPIPSSGAEEVDCDRDHALATALQEQEREFAMLDTTESDDEGDEDEYEDEDESYLPSADDFDGGFFTSQELADLELLEEEEEDEFEDEDEEEEDDEEEDEDELEEDSNTEEEEEDEIDPDELSYEDLIALGEIAGQENQGLSPEEIISTLSPYICKSIHSNTGIDKCVICQVEYEDGEGLVALRCDHPFHEACINQWLQIKKICPICCKEAVKQKTE